MASTSPFTQATNFFSAVQGGVDPRTGQFSFSFLLASLCSNNTLGPQLPLSLQYSPLTSGDPLGLGTGFTLGLTSFDDRNGKKLLQLSTGEQYKTYYTGSGQLAMRQRKLDTVHLDVHRNGSGTTHQIYVTHKTGEREILGMVGGAGVYYPVSIETPLGHTLTLMWDTQFRLSRVVDGGDQRVLCTFEYPVTGLVNIHLWPGGTEEIRIVLTQYNHYLSKISQRCGDDTLVWSLLYDNAPDHHFNGNHPLYNIQSPTGLSQSVVYDSGIMRFATPSGQGALPAVSRHTLLPGAAQPAEVHTYKYSSSNFMGYGADLKSWERDSDNLYNVLSAYDYWSVETFVGDPSAGIPARLTERHYDNYHLLISEKETVAGTTLSTERETAYFASPGVRFIDQPVIFQMPASQKVVWSDGHSARSEITSLAYDAVGNLKKKMDPDGTVTECEYYPATGAGDDCPADPNGFTRLIKSKTVTFARGVYRDVPVMRTVWRYRSLRPHKGSTLTGCVVQADVTHFSDALRMGSQAFEYTDDPASHEHGRMKSLITTVYGEDGAAFPSVQEFVFDSAITGQLKQLVTSTVEEHPGEAGTRKLRQSGIRIQSSLTGRLILETDAADNSVSYTYDAVGRLITQTHHPDKPTYRSVESHMYELPEPDRQQLAQTTFTDIRGNQTRTRHDGMGRVILEMVRDPEGKLGWQVTGKHTYDVQGRRYHSIHTDILRNTDNAGESLQQQVLRRWDNWGLTASETIVETGVTAHRIADPVGRVWPDKMSLGQMMTVDTWSVADTTGKVSPKSRTYYDLSHRPVITENWAVSLDGKGWEATPYSVTRQEWDTAHRLRVSEDALGLYTTFTYDRAGRTVATTYADGCTVKRAFSPFSHTAMATKISLTDPAGKETILGHQTFDGLGRLIRKTSGGRTTTLTYATDWQHTPSVVTGPDGAVQKTQTDHALGEAPVDIRASGNAVNVNQSYAYELNSGRILRATENETDSHFDIWNSGLLKTETTRIVGGASHGAAWQYSLGGLPQVYTGVEQQAEIREWSSLGRLISIRDPAVKVSLAYDSLGRLTSWTATEKAGATIMTTVEFDGLGREQGRSIRYKDKKTASSQSISQRWTVNHQLSQRILVRDGQVVRKETYTYDLRNRLVDYHCGGSDLPSDPYGNAFTRQQFTFDALGNIVSCLTTLSEQGVTDTSICYFENPDDPCQLTRVSHSLKDKRFHYPETIILEYDKAGRMTRDDAGRTLRYDALGRLYEVKNGATYGYDARNRMVYQKVESTKQSHRLYYRANRLIGEWVTKGDGKAAHPEDSQVRLIYAAGSCAAQTESEKGNAQTLLTGTDGKQSVIVTGKDGNVSHTTYAPYGYTPMQKEEHTEQGPGKVDSALAFEIEFSDSTVMRTAMIFSNGLNQVAVTVRTVLIDKQSEVVHLTPAQLWSALTVKTTRGEEVKKQPMDADYQHLSVWNAPGSFSHAVRYGPSESAPAIHKEVQDEDYSAVTVYLSTGELNGAYELYAELAFPHFSETTEGGTGPFLSHLNINTIPAINYGEAQNWRLDVSSPWQEKSKPEIESMQKGAPYRWTDGGTVKSRYRKVYIINTNQTPDSPVRIWARQVTGTTLDSHNNAGYFSFGQLSTHFGWGYYEEHYEVIAWWVEPALRQPNPLPDVGYADRTDNYCYLQAFNHYYRINLNGEGVHQRVDTLRDDAITLYQWDISYENTSIYPCGWSDIENDAQVAVTDNFGNSGQLSIHFPVDGWDPQLTFGKPPVFRIPDGEKQEEVIQQMEGLPVSQREAFLRREGVYHLALGPTRERLGDSPIIRTVRQKFGSLSVPSEGDFDTLIAVCSAAADVLPGGAASGGGLTIENKALGLQGGRGFSMAEGKFTFDVATYLKP